MIKSRTSSKTMKIAQFPYMPQVINITIMKENGGYCALLKDYDAFTEANTFVELEEMINDLIYELFEVPKSAQRKIKYINTDNKNAGSTNIKTLTVMSTPDLIKQTYLNGN